MNKEKKIIIIVFSAFAVLVLLATFLFLNSFFNNRSIKKVKTTENIGVENILQNNAPATSSVPLSPEEKAARLADQNKLKDLIESEFESYQKIPAKNISDFFKNVDECAKLEIDAQKDVCIAFWAKDKKDSTLCLKATDAGRQDCQDGVLAVNAKMISDCDSLHNVGIKRECLKKFAK